MRHFPARFSILEKEKRAFRSSIFRFDEILNFFDYRRDLRQRITLKSTILSVDLFTKLI